MLQKPSLNCFQRRKKDSEFSQDTRNSAYSEIRGTSGNKAKKRNYPFSRNLRFRKVPLPFSFNELPLVKSEIGGSHPPLISVKSIHILHLSKKPDNCAFFGVKTITSFRNNGTLRTINNIFSYLKTASRGQTVHKISIRTVLHQISVHLISGKIPFTLILFPPVPY